MARVAMSKGRYESPASVVGSRSKSFVARRGDPDREDSRNGGARRLDAGPGCSACFHHVVQACLAKQPSGRWQTAHDVRMQLEWIQAQGSRTELVALSTMPHGRAIWLWCAVAALFGAAFMGAALRFSSADGEPFQITRFNSPGHM